MEPKGRRVAVTGLGVVAPCGIGRDAYWDGLLGPGDHVRTLDRDRGLGPQPVVRRHPRRPAGPTAWSSSPSPPRPRRSTRPATSASTRPGSARSSPPASAVCARSRSRSSCAVEKGERRVSPFLVPMMMANAAGAAISMRFGPAGPERDGVHGVRRRHARHRQRRPPDRLGAVRRRRHRRRRGRRRRSARSPGSAT